MPRILLVEDDKSIRMALEFALTRAGYEVTPAPDGVSALERARKVDPDLVLLDTNRPNMQPEHNLIKNIVYAGSKENVRLTMVNGKILYENGEFFIGEDPAKIYAEAARMAKEITA